jgi:hypothetical protein
MMAVSLKNDFQAGNLRNYPDVPQRNLWETVEPGLHMPVPSFALPWIWYFSLTNNMLFATSITI